MKANVHVTLKTAVLDPQGKAVQHALGALGFQGIKGVRQGKYLEIDMDGTDPAKALADVEAMCQTLLANTVIENYRVEIVE
jgi:phosphoribosylformylglycinamidine synthase subunit PurS